MKSFWQPTLFEQAKRCSACGEMKDRREFSKNRRLRDGLQCYCISCNRAYNRKWKGDINNRVPYQLRQSIREVKQQEEALQAWLTTT